MNIVFVSPCRSLQVCRKPVHSLFPVYAACPVSALLINLSVVHCGYWLRIELCGKCLDVGFSVLRIECKLHFKY
jgi:hypothetical protein